MNYLRIFKFNYIYLYLFQLISFIQSSTIPIPIKKAVEQVKMNINYKNNNLKKIGEWLHEINIISNSKK
jgi:hypothetical protein